MHKFYLVMDYASANFHATVVFFCEKCMYTPAEDCRRLAYTGVMHDIPAGKSSVWITSQRNRLTA